MPLLNRDTADVVIVGAGAAGLAAAVFCARAAPGTRIVCVDGAKNIGAKILVSGGARCNVTNRVVTERDFWGGDRRVIRNVLRAYPAERAAAFFEELGVALHEEEDGKFFPDTNRARTVLDALIRALREAGAQLRQSCRISGIQRAEHGFIVTAEDGTTLDARAVVLATGGRSLPKTGSDGVGYQFARTLGHGYVETTPALAPLILSDSWQTMLAGVAHPVAVTVRCDSAPAARLEGSMLWTHFGVSGPVMLDASRHWLRARLEGRAADVVLHVLPGATFSELEAWMQAQQRDHPRALVRTVVASRLPASVADAWIAASGIDAETAMAHLAREDRRRLIGALLDTPLGVVDSRGYNYAEVTAGGIPLSEIDSATMESRVCQGLYLIGEMLDVDGRIGGFNFQWAWSSAWVAANAIARALRA
jgi:predicted Rossmann fold flavoprotein